MHDPVEGATVHLPDVPMPTQDYSERTSLERVRRFARVTQMPPITLDQLEPVADTTDGQAAAPTHPAGARVFIFKQDPSVAEIAVRKAFLPMRVFSGPRDARIQVKGMPMVTPNVFGDLIVDPSAQPEAFDAVHTFAVVRMTLTMIERALGATLPWQWNRGGNVDALAVHPRAGVTQNAFYSRNEKALKFFFFDTGSPPRRVFTCRSFDIVAHETGHAVLDALKPGWLLANNPPQTGGLHESFGDLMAIFLALGQLDQCEALIAQTKADLHARNFLADVAEEFGMALGRPNSLRNADNNLRLSQVGTQVHAISQVFTGGVFDVLADIFAFERKPLARDDAAVLLTCSEYMASLVIRAIRQAPDMGATYAHVVQRMLALVASDGKPPAYRQAIVNAFVAREVIAAPSPAMMADEAGELEIAAAVTDADDATQDRTGCCGTMTLGELDDDASLDAELTRLGAEDFA